MIKYLEKIFKSGWINFKRQGFLTFATSIVMFVAITLCTLLYMLQGGINFLTDEIKDKIDISVYFNEQVSREQILEIRDEAVKLPEVKKIDYVSPEEAYEKFVNAHQDDPYLESLQAIEINPFLPSLVVKAYEPSQYQTISDYFKKEELKDLVYEVNDYRRGEVIEKFSGLASGIRNIGLFVTIFLSLVAVIVTFNTLRLSIYSQREEIEIMRLVGAKNSFVRGPFLMQGIFSGFFAAILCFITFFLVLFFFQTNINNGLMGFDIYNFFISNIFIIFLLQLAIGTVLGLISSFFAVRKYLKD